MTHRFEHQIRAEELEEVISRLQNEASRHRKLIAGESNYEFVERDLQIFRDSRVLEITYSDQTLILRFPEGIIRLSKRSGLDVDYPNGDRLSC
jgi:hypothetical protein